MTLIPSTFRTEARVQAGLDLSARPAPPRGPLLPPSLSTTDTWIGEHVQAHLDFQARQSMLDLNPAEAHPDFGDETLRLAFLAMLRGGQWYGQVCQATPLNVRDVLGRQQAPQQPGFLFACTTRLHGLFWTPDASAPALLADRPLPTGWLFLGREGDIGDLGPHWIPEVLWEAVQVTMGHLWAGETLNLTARGPGPLDVAALHAAQVRKNRSSAGKAPPRLWDRDLLYPETHAHLATLSPDDRARLTPFFTRKNLLERFCPVIRSHLLILRRIETRCGRMILSFSPGPHPARWNTTQLYTLTLDGRVIQRDLPGPHPGLDATEAFLRREYAQEIEAATRH